MLSTDGSLVCPSISAIDDSLLSACAQAGCQAARDGLKKLERFVVVDGRSIRVTGRSVSVYGLAFVRSWKATKNAG